VLRLKMRHEDVRDRWQLGRFNVRRCQVGRRIDQHRRVRTMTQRVAHGGMVGALERGGMAIKAEAYLMKWRRGIHGG